MTDIGIIILKEYRLLSIAAILDVFEAVNKIQKERGLPDAYKISLFSLPQEGETQAVSFHSYSLIPVSDEVHCKLVLIPSFSTDHMQQAIEKNAGFIPWLVKQYQAGAEIASFCSGAFLLGASKLLNGKVATTHVDAGNGFAAAFPEVILKVDKTVTEDGRLYTSGGSTSSFHLLLHLVQKHCGKDMAVRIAKIFAIDMDRRSQSYFSTFRPSYQHNDELVAMVQQKIETNYQEIGTIEEIMKEIPSSRRNLVRRFKQVTGIAPIEYLQQTRIEAGKKLLEQTNQQMTEVITNTGYNDPKAFRKVFRKIVGMTPTDYRERFQMR